MTDTLTIAATADAPGAAPALPSGDFTPEPVPDFSDWVNEGLAQAKEAQRDALTVANTLAQMFAQCVRASTQCQRRMVEMAQANTAASYELARELMTAESFTQLMTVSVNGARHHAETAAAQIRELSDLARKAATETAEPLTANIARVFKQAA